MKPTSDILLLVRKDLSELERVSRELEDFGQRHGLSAADLTAILLATDEILTNITLYAFADHKDHQASVRAEIDGNTLKLEIEDDGPAFDPCAVPAPATDVDLEERMVGGLGIHIVRRLMDEMSYRRKDDRNLLTLKLHLRAGAPAAASATRAKARISETDEGGAVTFTVAGHLDAHGATLLEEKLRRRLASGSRYFVFDCDELDSLSSAGLRVLLIAAKESAAAGGAVALASPRTGISETIEIAALSTLLPIYETRAQALAAVAKL
jgi:anti-anti-sigma factor